jgi:membrane-bound metal-dependent hydrolase YbcI (DUF457 family)
MSFPIAHGLLGATVVAACTPDLSLKKDWRSLLVGAVVACLPDLDYFVLIKLFHLPQSWHRGPTHSLAFALAVGALAALLVRRGTYLRRALTFWAAAASHGILDLFNRYDPVELLWPITKARYAFGVRPYYNYPQMRAEPAPLELVSLAKVCLLEAAVFGTLFMLVLFVRTRAGRKKVSRV